MLSKLAIRYSLIQLPYASINDFLHWPPFFLVNPILICKIKADNCHGLMVHPAWVPLYSTQLLIPKGGFMIVLLINLSTVVESTHITINQKNHVFGCVLSPMWYHNDSLSLYIGPLTSALPAVLQCMHAHYFCQKPKLTSPRFKQCYLGQFFLDPSKAYPSLEWFCSYRIELTRPLLSIPIIDVIQY